MTEFTIERANDYIVQAIRQVNQQYKPLAHFSAPVGWLNDPNGFVVFRGEYHLFYQYYPYGTQWGPMHWGHAKSKDGFHWEDLPVALAPDQAYDKDGCFSGTAIVKDDQLWLMYTGHIVQEDGSVRQVQNMAYSEDGIHFTKVEQNPVLDESDLPEGISPADFRDPKIFERNGRYYALMAARKLPETGCLVLAGSDDLLDWQFESIFLEGNLELGTMWECPDYFQLDGKDCLILSPMRVPIKEHSYHNINSTFFMTGQVDWQEKKFRLETVEELDHGHDFYAPQTLENEQGERLMIAWQHTWGRRNVTHELDHGWALSMSIPRKLELKEGVLYQTSLALNHASEVVETASLEIPLLVQVAVEEEGDVVLRLGSEADYLLLSYDSSLGVVALDRQGLFHSLLGEETTPVTKRSVAIKENQLQHLSFILDRNSIEVFINHGSASLSSNVYFDGTRVPELHVQKGVVTVHARRLI